MEAAIYFFIGLVITVILIAIILFYTDYRQRQQERWEVHRSKMRTEAMQRQREITTLRYDNLGNPEVYYNRDNGRWFVPPIGNSPVPTQLFVQPGQAGSSPRQTELRPPSKSDIVIRAWTDKLVNGAVEEPEKLPVPTEPPELSEPSPERKFELNGTAERANGTPNDAEFRQILAELKARGEGKEASIVNLGLANAKGNSKAWKYWSEVWDGLPEKEQ